MCGIFGVLNFKPENLDVARESLHTITHRGPDQWGEHVAENIYLGHRRLSIRDLSEAGRQPFVDKETGVAVIVNGETWNDTALREELGSERYISNSDSETFLHGYLAWGVDGLLSRLDGFYGAAIYDPRIQKLFILKDKWGKKPLYYATVNGQVVFASEAKALLEYDDSLRVFDYEGIKHWIAYRGSHSARTIFYGVNKLTQGTYLTVDTDLNIQQTRHFDLIAHAAELGEKPAMSEGQLDSEVNELLVKGIDKRMISDVPVGLQLSGGVDSSLVAAMTREVSDAQFSTFSVVFNEEADRKYSEEQYSNYVAEKYNFDHHKFEINNQSIADNFEHVVHLFDGMLDIPNAVPIYMLAEYAKEFITVFLTGEGADELFGGYGKFNTITNYQKPAKFAKLLPDAFFNCDFKVNKIKYDYVYKWYIDKYYSGNTERMLSDVNSFVSPFTIERFFGDMEEGLLDHMNTDVLSEFSFTKQLIIVDHMTYLNFLLERQDKASMGAGMEARLPFVDQDLVEYVMQLPADVLVDAQTTKKPLKRLAEKYFSHDFVYRPKDGFALPITDWLERDDGLGAFHKKVYSDDFLFLQMGDREGLVNYLQGNEFDLKQLSYCDSEKDWIKWFLTVLAATQEIFKITAIK